MGNCQAIDNAALLLQHPNGKVEKLYSSVTAHQIMKINSGHYVSLLLTTTTTATNNKTPVRVRRIKLLKPNDSLVLGQIYRLVTAQEVMKGLCAKKYAKLKQLEYSCEKLTQKSNWNPGSVLENSKQVKQEKHRNSTGARCRAWHPSLQSISEAAC
ncbi:uncharacterized protein [Solanum lycopersicum]|uniref:T10O24.15, related n=1 Tax=Solanum lycopersicum TaxID=4081 RepID=Q53J17_SOLLC|nr:uncharacterized protein LOC101245768 [Solanum lycopersicum]AAX95759.1 T10O24.15, related [Solanum lycopersicum]